MRNFIVFSLLCSFLGVGLAEKTKDGVTYNFPITRVVDGDTVAFESNFLPKPLKPEMSIRVFGVDTPEKSFRAKCDAEAKMGAASTEFTKKKVKEAKKTEIVIMDWDKYGGRVLGDVILDDHSLRRLLIDNGFAREYYGEAKQSWCVDTK